MLGQSRALLPHASFLFLSLQVKFMWNRIRAPCKPKGVILADDMGLGKTVQIMALLSALLKKTGTLR